MEAVVLGALAMLDRAALQTMLTRLRHTIGAEAAARIETVSSGYLLDLQPGELDMHRFGELCGRGYAAHAAGDWEAAVRLLGIAGCCPNWSTWLNSIHGVRHSAPS